LDDGVGERPFLRKQSAATRDHPVRIRARILWRRHSPRDGAPPAAPSSESKTMLSLAQ
jgi:hypothetical protein